jgi:protein gp37
VTTALDLHLSSRVTWNRQRRRHNIFASVSIPSEEGAYCLKKFHVSQSTLKSAIRSRNKSKYRGTTTTRPWNPWIGCFKVSPGCDNCYIFRILRPSHNPNVVTPTKGIDPATNINDAPPLHWGKRRDIVFTCSLSDFFIRDADAWRPRAWEVIRRTPHITYNILTKRPQRILTHPNICLPNDWTTVAHPNGYPNVALGVTVEKPQFLWRIDMLNKIPCSFRWLSAEPLLEPLPTLHRYLGGNQVKMVHCGGESDRWHPRRPTAPPGGTWLDAFRQIRDQCTQATVPFFFLQQGGSQPCSCCGCKWGCRLLDGNWHQEFPFPTLIAEGPRQGKRQRDRILSALTRQNIETFRTPIQTETKRGNPHQVDRVLLTKVISKQTLNQLQAALPNTVLTLETWP